MPGGNWAPFPKGLRKWGERTQEGAKEEKNATKRLEGAITKGGKRKNQKKTKKRTKLVTTRGNEQIT